MRSLLSIVGLVVAIVGVVLMFQGDLGGSLFALAGIVLMAATYRRPAPKPDARPQAEIKAMAPAAQVRRAEPAPKPKVTRAEHARALLEKLTGMWLAAEPSISPNGRYAVFAGNGTDKDRQVVRGVVILVDLEANSVEYGVGLRDTWAPEVSDDGLVLVQDWGTPAAVTLLESDGQVRWRHLYRANTNTASLSPDGTRAYVLTLRSDHVGESNRLFLYDVASGELLWSREHPRRREPEFAPEFRGNQLFAVRRFEGEPLREFRFSEEGELSSAFDEFALEMDIEYKGIVKALIPRIAEALERKPPDLATANVYLSRFDLGGLAPDDTAAFLRARGEVAQASGDLRSALDDYEAALELNSRIGLKGRVEKLRRQVGRADQLS